MKCSSCGNEVALAKVCPYCGSDMKVAAEDASNGGRRGRGPTGSFRGSVDAGRRAPQASGSSLLRVLRFFLEPRVHSWEKAVALLALVYILSPLDLLPGIPLFSWIDDAAVAALAWRWIGDILAKLDRRS